MPTDPSSPLTRKPGAPTGNKNRYLHGRYARRPDPALDPEQASPPSRLTLAEEIAYLRAYMHRTAMIGATTANLDYTQEVLHTLSLAATALSRLIHTENWLSQASGIHVQRDELPAILARMESLNKKVLAGLQSIRPRLTASNLEQVAAQVDTFLAESTRDPAFIAPPPSPDSASSDSLPSLDPSAST
jgi:hypothetical protein